MKTIDLLFLLVQGRIKGRERPFQMNITKDLDTLVSPIPFIKHTVNGG